MSACWCAPLTTGPPVPLDISPTAETRRAARRTLDVEIARLAVPAFAALVCEPLFLLADSAIVGHLGTAQLAALGISGAVVQTAVGLFIFLAYGTTSVVARSVGAGARDSALASGIDGMWLAAVIGALAGIGCWLLSSTLVGALTSDPSVRRFAVSYLHIASAGIPALLLMLAATGVLRGLQDTRTPLVVAVIANLANIALNLALVYGLQWGIVGSAAGSLIAQAGAAAVLMIVVARTARRYDARLAPHVDGILKAFAAGMPLLVRTLTLRVALLIAIYVAAAISTTAIAAHQVAFTLWTFLAFALDAIAIAGQAITGRLLGASNARSARAATRRMMQWGLVSGIISGALVALARPLVVPLFTSDSDVQHLLSSVLLIVAVQQPVAGLVFVLDGVLIGAGDGRYLATAGVVTVVVFAPLALAVMWLGLGLAWLWWAFTAFMLVRLTTLLWRERRDSWLVLGAGHRSA